MKKLNKQLDKEKFSSFERASVVQIFDRLETLLLYKRVGKFRDGNNLFEFLRQKFSHRTSGFSLLVPYRVSPSGPSTTHAYYYFYYSFLLLLLLLIRWHALRGEQLRPLDELLG